MSERETKMNLAEQLVRNARRMAEIGQKRSGDVTGSEHMEYINLERTGLTFEVAKGIVAAMNALAEPLP